MCGIAGIFNLDGQLINKSSLNKMTKIIQHRGPDDEGFLLINTKTQKVNPCHHDDTIDSIKKQTDNLFNNFTANLGFGFRRLSILDLTEKGHQPMSNDDGTLWIVYNGEIYNYIELRDELSNLGYTFHTGTDTEVILKSYQTWGEDCLHKFNGMWSFALWDNPRQKLFCARDRFGIKPFNYYFDGRQFIFGSEPKQILINKIDKSLNYEMIYRSLKLNSFLIYGDETYFKKISLLPHSHYLTIQNGKLQITRYYDLNPETFESSKLSFPEAVKKYQCLFEDSVKLRMRSDVEVGSCLSGGLDSSAIVSTAAKLSDKTFNTFSAYYNLGPLYDERKWIFLVAKKTNSNTHLISPTPMDFLNDFTRMTFINDYPITGSSLISQHYVMKLAQQYNTTVLLDGQGSDEITGGYNHTFYRYYADLIRNFKWLRFIKEYPYYLKYNQKGSGITKIAKTIFTTFSKETTIYREEAKRFLYNPLTLTFDNKELFRQIKDLKTSKLSNFLYNLLMSTMIQTLLHFEDRNSMGYSIESRIPFLDFRLVEFAFSLPPNYKVHKDYGKYIHREALRKIVPLEIIERKDKVSFNSPGEEIWLKNKMQPYVTETFNSTNYKNRELFNHKLIEKAYKKYVNGDARQSRLIWRVLALEKWFNIFIDSNEALIS